VWVGRAWGWQSEEEAKNHRDIVSVRDRPSGSTPPPAGLDWELWLGPAPSRPFHEVYWPGPKWYRWWDFGNGTMSDLGSHWIDLPWWALKLDHPLTVAADGPPPHAEIAPASMHAEYTYGAAGSATGHGALVSRHNETQTARGRKIPQWGSGTLLSARAACCWRITTSTSCCRRNNSATSNARRPPCRVQRPPPGVDSRLQNRRANHLPLPLLRSADDRQSSRNVAYRTGTKLDWDPLELRAKNCRAADPYIQRSIAQAGNWRSGFHRALEVRRTRDAFHGKRGRKACLRPSQRFGIKRHRTVALHDAGAPARVPRSFTILIRVTEQVEASHEPSFRWWAALTPALSPGEGGPCGAIEAGGHAELMPAWCCDDPDGDDCFGRAPIFPHCADGAPSPGCRAGVRADQAQLRFMVPCACGAGGSSHEP